LKVIRSSSAAQTVRLGRRLGRELASGDVVLLIGELGSGKTVLCKGLASGYAGVDPAEVTSPTFVLVHRYGRERPLYHADLYRLERPEAIAALALEDLLDSGPLIIEWGEKAEALGLTVRWRIQLEVLDRQRRRITIQTE
jgi:tRNA threonylcarbamoyladenosine biosynthesis protein TsaE